MERGLTLGQSPPRPKLPQGPQLGPITDQDGLRASQPSVTEAAPGKHPRKKPGRAVTVKQGA